MNWKTLTLMILLMLPILASAQKPATNMDYKKYTGRYGSNSGICLFDDGRFLLYGYATAVFGDYKINNESLLFFPDKLELFEVYGHHNKSIAKGMRANFKGFERGDPTYIDLSGKGMQRVFNEDANCFDGPFVYETVGVTKQIGLVTPAVPASFRPARNGQFWTYDNKEGYNDFILIYNAPKREYEDFQGRVLSAEGQKFIQLSNYGGEEGYRLNLAEEKNWSEMLDWKKQYDAGRAAESNNAYVNQHYRVFPELSLANYKLDAKKNLYTKNSGNNNDEEYFRDNEYQDDRALKKYVKIKPLKKQENAGLSGKQLEGSIFFSVCGEGSERSYHYKGLKPQTAAGKTTKLDTVAPMIVPPPPKQ